MIKRYIEVSFQREGIHRYPAAAHDPKLAKVSYLSFSHRHIFHFYVKLQVWHDDREVEFIMLKTELEALYTESLKADFKSCEMLADDLLLYIGTKYPGREAIIRVYEDDENGAIVEFKPDE